MLIHPDLLEIILGKNEKLPIIIQNVIGSFNAALNCIDNILFRKKIIDVIGGCPYNIHSTYSSEYNQLKKFTRDESDCKILLDSFYLMQNHFRQKTIAFISNDKEHIIKPKPDIERILSGLKIFELT